MSPSIACNSLDFPNSYHHANIMLKFSQCLGKKNTPLLSFIEILQICHYVYRLGSEDLSGLRFQYLQEISCDGTEETLAECLGNDTDLELSVSVARTSEVFVICLPRTESYSREFLGGRGGEGGREGGREEREGKEEGGRRGREGGGGREGEGGREEREGGRGRRREVGMEGGGRGEGGEGGAGADPENILRGGPESKFCKMEGINSKNVQH